MRSPWIHCCVAALLVGSAACKKDSEPKEGTDPETVTQSVKPPAADEAKPALAEPEKAEEAAIVNLAVGDTAPALTLTLQDGKTLELSSLAGKPLAIYFYPKDDTPGCTVEAQGIRDQWGEFEKAGIAVIGVSMQDAASHQAFIEKHKLPFSLAVDDGSVTRAFGVPVRDGQYAARHTFLIGADGKIQQVWREVDPGKHAGELLEAATAARAEPEEPILDEDDAEDTDTEAEPG